MKALTLLLALIVGPALASAQELNLPTGTSVEDGTLAKAMPAFAVATLAQYREANRDAYLGNVFRLQLASGHYSDALKTLDAWRGQHVDTPASEPVSRSIGVQLYLQAKASEARDQVTFADAFDRAFKDAVPNMTNRKAFDVDWALGTMPRIFEELLKQTLAHHTGTRYTVTDAIDLIRIYLAFQAYQSFAPRIDALITADETRRYIIQEDVLIPIKGGATISAMVVRPRTSSKLPTALFASPETAPRAFLYNAKLAAAHGYVGVSSDTHGKRLSPDPVVLFEDDAKDMYGVIDWISRQPWSDGKVGMYGGSSAGFTQWAAAKSGHPALKTIVPICPDNPGFGLPMNNNIFLTANYDYAFYVANTKMTDPRFSGSDRWPPMVKRWFESGRPYREIDQVDGIPNNWLQRWLQHPAYDAYWQNMTPFRQDYARLNIPVLAIDGYYDDGQNYAMLNLEEHYRYNSKAEHYLVIGPYDHFGTRSDPKPSELRGYTIDPTAQFDTSELTFQWFDHVMRGGHMPVLLQDRINYEVMGGNVWKHASSLARMSNHTLTLYLTSVRTGDYYQLAAHKPAEQVSLRQAVDFADRMHMSFNPYPNQIVASSLDRGSALSFVSKPFDHSVEVSGMFTARLKMTINKKDMDIVMALYEVLPDGRFFHLAYTIARASYARDMSERQLLTPGALETIPLTHTLLVSKRLSKGSRLLLMLDVQKSDSAEVNYGTGKDVSDESIADAKSPLQIEWRTGSVVNVPIWQ